MHRRALLCGAGRSMREGCLAASSHQQQQYNPGTGPQTSAGCHANSLNGQLVVDLPYTAPQLSVLLAILYEHNVEVRSYVMCSGRCTPLLAQGVTLAPRLAFASLCQVWSSDRRWYGAHCHYALR
jgi:hypothetical protein